VTTRRRLDADDRGQLLLVAAGVVALALFAMALASLQLAYHPDVGASTDADPAGDRAVRVLDRAVRDARRGVPANHSWANRSAAVDRVRTRLAPRLATLESSRVAQGTTYSVSYNGTAAASRAATACPGGPDRQFGPCEADRGVVVQERLGETHVVGVAFDVVVRTPDGRVELTVWVPREG
jgi:hypothetical protein